MHTVPRAGWTLLEMIFVLVVLGLLAGISGARLTRTQLLTSSTERQLTRVREQAVGQRRAYVAKIGDGRDSTWVWALPDGRIIGALRGEPHAP